MDMDDRRMLRRALALAHEYHDGQWRTDPQTGEDTEPYLLHPARVASRVRGPVAKAAALLHDVVEDTDATLDLLRLRGFPRLVVETVDALTQRKGTESKPEYWARVAQHPVGRYVKVSDLIDNVSGQAEGSSMWKRYAKATGVMRGALYGPGFGPVTAPVTMLETLLKDARKDAERYVEMFQAEDRNA